MSITWRRSVLPCCYYHLSLAITSKCHLCWRVVRLDMSTAQIFRFDSAQLQKVLISTRLMTHNGFQELIRINSRLELVFWNLIPTDSRLKRFSRILIEIDSWLKKLSRVWVQINSWLKMLSRVLIQIDSRLKSFSGILIRINSWVNYTIVIGSVSHWSWFGLTLFWACPIWLHLVWSFWGFRLKCLPEILIWINSWLKQNVEDLNWFNSWLKRLSGNWLRINSRLKRIPRYWFKYAHDLPGNWLWFNLRLKRIPRYRFKSTHDSSEKHFILGRLMIQLWVIPMSGCGGKFEPIHSAEFDWARNRLPTHCVTQDYINNNGSGLINGWKE